MYYRRKIILSILHQFDGALGKTDFQKLLFLYNKENKSNYYDFVPYKYGCFSFQAQQDISTMMKYGQVSDTDDGWTKIDDENYINELKMKDKISLITLFKNYKDIRGNQLIKYVYDKYPYYAINSEIKERVLDINEIKQIDKHRPVNNITALYTIGYEGISVEEYANKLIQHDIKLLCDVRKNPLSMKYGFSKNQLKYIVENVGIEYLHIPELGIHSDKRKNLESFEDYKLLFDDYKETVIPEQQESLKFIDKLVNDKKRIALTCFEADHHYCHRNEITHAVLEIKKEEYDVIHI
ncbi:DUF488 family protein [Bacteroidota bacterium]